MVRACAGASGNCHLRNDVPDTAQREGCAIIGISLGIVCETE
jgi:hypothetical protein